MKNNNYTLLNNITTHSNRQPVLPFNFEEQLPEHDIVFLLNAILGELDYTRLLRLYSPLGRKSPVEPDVMFKIIVLALSKGVYSLREIQERCVLNLRYRWLLQMRKAPSHMAIGRFILRITVEKEQQRLYGNRKECQKHGNGISNKTIQINENYNMLQQENMERFTSDIGKRFLDKAAA